MKDPFFPIQEQVKSLKARKSTACAGLTFWLVAAFIAPSQARQIVTNTAPVDQGPAVYKKLSLEELMNLDVTSVAKAPQPYGEAPAAIQVITGNEIERSGASSIPESLRLADNLEVAQKNSHDWAISARGFNTSLANKLLVLMDGRTLYTPLFSGVFWDVQDYLLEDIDRIEVISGPGGTLWGANAVNGVINITTKSAKETQGVYLEAGGGTELQDFTGVRYGGALASNVYFRLYAKYFDLNSEVLPDGKPAHDSWYQGQTGFRIDAQPSAPNLLTVQGDYYVGDEDVPTGGMAKVEGGNFLGRFTHTFSDDSDVSLQAYFDRTYLRDPIPASANPFAGAGLLADALDTYDVDFQHHFHLGGRNNMAWGLGYRFTQDAAENASGLVFLPPRLGQNLYSGFVQDEIKLHEKLHLTLGTKLEHNDYTGYELEPSARLQWDIATNHMVWGAISRAVRTASRVDRDEYLPTYIKVPALAYLLSGQSNFVSEKLIAYELGYRARLGEKVSGSISTFYNVYTDIRSLGPATALPIPLEFQNNVEGETYGVELSANYQVLDWWRLHGGYNYLKEYLHVAGGHLDVNNALNEIADPQNQFSLRSSMDLPHGLELDNGLRWVDTLHINNGAVVGTVPSYFELDARLGWHVTKTVELSLVGQNLLQGQHPEYGFPGAERVEIARTFYAKVSYRW